LKNVPQAYPFIYTSGVPSSIIRNVQNVSSFFSDLGTGDLPTVSFVMALGSDGLDEHPPSNVTAGEQWTVSIVNAIMRSNYWDSSAIFITWDEGGGYYDHVIPPQVLTIDHEFDHPLQVFGQRVPLLVISPYAKENYVSQTILNHMSLLRFIEFNWGLPSLNANVASSNNLLDFFSFNSPRGPIILGTEGKFAASDYPIPLQTQIEDLKYPRIGSMNSSGFGAAPKPDYRLVASGLVVAIVLGVLGVRRRRTGDSPNNALRRNTA
jgi:phospholipase C